MDIKSAFFISLVIVFLVGACTREDTAKVEEAGEPGVAGVAVEPDAGEGEALPEGHPTVSKPVEDLAEGGAHPSSGGDKEVRISDEVRARWTEVTLEVLDGSTKASKVITMDVGSTVSLNGTGFSLRVEVFIPDYAMFDDHIGSRSNEPNNVAVMVELMEGDKPVAMGWVFKAYPAFNSYGHERFTIGLVGPASGP